MGSRHLPGYERRLHEQLYTPALFARRMMSEERDMESLYRTYRPLTFESVVGQQHIVSTLEHAVLEGRLSHAYLFCGPRGTGKTTMARILAKALLCEHAAAARETGASGCMPDGTCSECTQIAEGTHPDVYELDAASRTGVDNVREEIIGSVNFAPVRGAYKIYIIDEVHMLTTAAFNALLKTLEEPPSHVVFVLCTTDPQKIPETILSRCQRFDFHRISNEDIVGRLAYICEQEGFDTEPEALEIVARHARGGMRDALSTLEQLSVFGNGAVHAADARALLGEVAQTVLTDFSNALAARDVPELFSLVRTQVDEGNDLLELTRDLIAHVRDVYVAHVAGARAEVLDATPEEAAALAQEAERFASADRLARVLTVLDDAALEMRTAADTRLVLEVALTRLARPEADLTLEALAERVERLEARLASGVPAGPLNAQAAAELMGAAAGRGGAAAGARETQVVGGGAAGGTAARAASAPVSAPAAVSVAAARPQTAAAPAGGVRMPPREGAATAAVPSTRSAAHEAAGGASAHMSAATPTEASGAKRAAAPTAGPACAESAAATSTSPTSASAVPVAAPATSAASSSAVSAESAPTSEVSAAAPVGSEVTSASSAPSADAGDLQRKWSEAVRRVVAKQASRGALLQSARATADDGSTLTVSFPKGSSFAIKMLGREDTKSVVLPIIREVFGPRTVTYVMEGSAPVAATPAAASAPAEAPVAAKSASVPSIAKSAEPTDAPAKPVAAPVTPTPTEAERTRMVGEPAVQVAESAAPGAALASETHVPAATSAPKMHGEAPATSATQTSPATPTSFTPSQAQQAADQVSGPTFIPEPGDIDADRRAWEDEQVPYDDATIAAYEEEGLPPFDMPFEEMPVATPTKLEVSAAAPAPSPAPQMPAAVPAQVSAAQPTGPSASPVPQVSSDPSAGMSSGGSAVPFSTNSPYANATVSDEVPHSKEEAQELLRGIFGAGVVLKGPDEA